MVQQEVYKYMSFLERGLSNGKTDQKSARKAYKFVCSRNILAEISQTDIHYGYQHHENKYHAGNPERQLTQTRYEAKIGLHKDLSQIIKGSVATWEI